MILPSCSLLPVPSSLPMRRGYTLVEILISVSLSLFLLLGVTQLFRSVGTSIADAQGTLMMTRNLDWTAMTLRNDLDNLTADVNKPSKLNNAFNPPGDSDGYFQIVEGMGVPYGVSATHIPMSAIALNSDSGGGSDSTVGDVDDILMFTVRAPAQTPFRGLRDGNVEESTMAEIIYFVRGNTLYRRVLLVLENNRVLSTTPHPNTPTGLAPPGGFYANNDVSVRLLRDSTGTPVLPNTVVPNTLSDLSRREHRFGHWSVNPFPHPIYYNTGGVDTRAWYYLRMPTLEECVHPRWLAGFPLAEATPTPYMALTGMRYGVQNYDVIPGNPYWDFWENPNGWISNSGQQDSQSGSWNGLVQAPRSPRAGEDIILTNVISFDVKVWNPHLERYADLGEIPACSLANCFCKSGNQSQIPCVYDTWSSTYDSTTQPPPYSEKLKGIEVTIRCFDPRSKNIKQIRIVKDFR